MKILHILSDTILGGAQKVCIDLANAANKEGYEVAVAAMKDGYLWEQLDPAVKQYQLQFMKKKINFDDFKVLKELKNIRKEYAPDIIHLHTTKPGVLGRYVFRKNKKHVIYTVHGFDTILKGHKKFLFVEQFFQRWSGSTVAVSKYDETNLYKTKIRKNLQTIYNGIDKNIIQQASTFPLTIKETKKILTIARIMPPKDFPMFIEVARHFENKDIAFIWMGGSQEKTLAELKEQYKIPNNVYLTGDVLNASNYLYFCDLFVLFSHYEGLPMSIIEAMSQGLPVIASNVGGIPELVDSTNGALVEDGNINNAINEIQKLLFNEESLKEKGNNSLIKYEKNFSLEKMWNSYKNLYNELLK